MEAGLPAEGVSSILWQQGDVVVIDIPRSISEAQGTALHAHNDSLLSSPAPRHPFIGNEPKTEVARAKLKGNSTDAELHEGYASIIKRALESVKREYHGEYCLPRPFVIEERGAESRKRKRLEEATSDSKATDKATNDDISQRSRQLAKTDALLSELSPLLQGHIWSRYSIKTEGAGLLDTLTTGSTYGLCISNRQPESAMLDLHPHSGEANFHFRMPPFSSFVLGDCSNTEDFYTAICPEEAGCEIAETDKVQTATSAQREPEHREKQFDVVIMDPPWPNRSVRRTHKMPGTTYSTLATLSDARDLITGMNLDGVLSERGLVGIWITNKPAIRSLVTGPSGLFHQLGVCLEEEWVWLKTTVHGEPCTPIDSLWRKPYEVFLLGRSGISSCDTRSVVETKVEVKKRVIIGVPDLHSRKPCLKALIEPLMCHASGNTRVLEVFARHLVAGWCSWGNECIKFNEQTCWRAYDGW